MTLHSKTNKGVRTKFTALLIAGLLALAALCCILVSKATNASAFNQDDFTPGDEISTVNTNIAGVTVEILFDYVSTADGQSKFKFIVDSEYLTSIGHEFVRFEILPSIPTTVTHENGEVYITAPEGHTNVLTGSMPGQYITVILKKVIPLPETPEKEGYTFTGWFLDSACTIPYSGQEITEDMTFYAGWKINTFTVTFDSVGGSAVTTQTVNWNTAATLTTPTKDGHAFLGWFDGETKYEGALIKANTTLTAKWQINTFTVTFDSAGGSAVTTQTLDWNTAATLTTPTKDGHTFLGWFDGETKYEGAPIKANTTLTAKWQIKTFTVTFDSAGGSSVPSQTLDWNTAATVPTLERTGYIFLGWFVGDTKYTDAAIKENTTLTARWQIKVYTVTFMVDGEVYKTLEVEHGTTLEKAMENADMSYFNLMADGIKDGKSGIVTGDLIAEAAAMTKKEKTAAFFSNNSWILWTLGAGFVLFIAISITLIVKKARG